MAINNSIIDVYSKQKGYNIIFTHVPTDTTVSFKAFLTDFSDAFSTNWTPDTVYGRIDPIQTFGGTSRVITVGFDIVSNDISEASSNLKAVRLLTRMMYPTYEQTELATTISKAPLMRVKLANLIGRGKDGSGSGLLGAITGFTIQPSIEAGFFDPAANVLYAKEYTANFTMNVLHEENPGGWISEVDTAEKGPPFNEQDPLQGPVLGTDTYRALGVNYDPTADDALLQSNDRAQFSADSPPPPPATPPTSTTSEAATFATSPSNEAAAIEEEILR